MFIEGLIVFRRAAGAIEADYQRQRPAAVTAKASRIPEGIGIASVFFSALRQNLAFDFVGTIHGVKLFQPALVFDFHGIVRGNLVFRFQGSKRNGRCQGGKEDDVPVVHRTSGNSEIVGWWVKIGN